MKIQAYPLSIGVGIPKQAFIHRLGGERQLLKILSALTVHEKPQPGAPVRYKPITRVAYKCDQNNVILPRRQARKLSPQIIDVPIEQYNTRAIEPAHWTPTAPFYAYQSLAAEHVCQNIFMNTNSAYIQMETGLGKTRFAMAVAAILQGPVFVVVPTKIIQQQWLWDFQKIFPQLCVGKFTNHTNTVPYDVLIGVVNTVRKQKNDFFLPFRLIVLDEAHELQSPQNSNILWLTESAQSVLGLTATPYDRPDGLDKIVPFFLGPPIWAITDIKGCNINIAQFAGRVREVDYDGDPEYCTAVKSSTGAVSAIETIIRLIQDPARLHVVVAEVERLYYMQTAGSPHGILVFAELRDYLPILQKELMKKLPAADIYTPELTSIVLRGGAPPGALLLAQQARVVLTTYGYSRRGVSINNMTALVLATPRKSNLSQIIGRITRLGSDERIQRIIVDIRDIRSPLCSQSTKRREIYKKKKYSIYRVKTNYKTYNMTPSYETLVWHGL